LTKINFEQYNNEKLHKVSKLDFVSNTIEINKQINDLNSCLDVLLSNYPTTVPLVLNTPLDLRQIINFFTIQDALLQKASTLQIDLQTLTSHEVNCPRIQSFIKFSGNDFFYNLDLFVLNNISNTNEIETILLNLPLQVKHKILDTIQKHYCYIVNSLFTGLLILDLQSSINSQTYEFTFNPVKQITADGIFIDYQNATQSSVHLKYYIDILMTGKKIMNNDLQNHLFFLMQHVPSLIDIHQRPFCNLHNLNSLNTETLVQEITKQIPGFLHILFNKTPNGFNDLKEIIKITFNEKILKNQLIWQAIITSQLSFTSFSTEHKNLIIQYCNKSKLKKHTYRIFNVILLLSLIQNSQNYVEILKAFLDNQNPTNYGAEKFAKLCKQILLASQLETANQDVDLTSPNEIIRSLQYEIIQKALKTLDLEGISQSRTFNEENTVSIIEPISYLTQEIPTEHLKTIVLGHVLNIPRAIKIYKTSQTVNTDRETIKRFLNPITIENSQQTTTLTTFDLDQVMRCGHYPELTCLNYINGSQREELIALALLNDRLLVQSITDSRVTARAILRLLQSKSDFSKHGILIDNMYGNIEGLRYILDLAWQKSVRDNFQLLIPHNTNRTQTTAKISNLLLDVTTFRSTQDYNIEVSQQFSSNQSDNTSSTLIEIINYRDLT